MINNYPPLVVYSETKDQYYKSLDHYDNTGDITPYLNYMKKRYKKMMTGVDGANLERMMIGCIDSTKAVADENAKLWEENKAIKELLSNALTKVAIVRFRAFEDMGSDLSYAVAMLDSHNNGVILSSIFAREDSRSYAKPIVNGTSTYPMTSEEEDALRQAMGK